MQLLTLPTGILATLLLSTIASGNPIPQDVPRPCIILPLVRTSYPLHQLVTYNPSNSTVDGKLLYIPTRFGIPENPPPSPLVIYAGEVPSGTNIVEATLNNTALYTRYWSTPARISAVTDRKGLSSVYFTSGSLLAPAPLGPPGAFQVTMGCDINGRTRDELHPVQGQFCVRNGRKPELELMVKSWYEYAEIKDDPNPCTDVTLVITQGKS